MHNFAKIIFSEEDNMTDSCKAITGNCSALQRASPERRVAVVLNGPSEPYNAAQAALYANRMRSVMVTPKWVFCRNV